VSQEQPEDLETRASLFGRLLIEGTESELQEFIAVAEQELSTQPMELLVRCKVLVDARLAAEPERKITYMDDPHQIRVRYWNTIADRLGAEIKFRTAGSSQNAPTRRGKNKARRGPEKDPAVAGRRLLVQQNADLSAKELCELLDRERILPPPDWQLAGLNTWVEAWRKRKSNVQVIFSKDRKQS
jgi:hypothetical protein